jgi:hypothetical protein
MRELYTPLALSEYAHISAHRVWHVWNLAGIHYDPAMALRDILSIPIGGDFSLSLSP